ncbi:hypothetical protein MCC93_25800 [Morococcus cerebrosus]|uniref:Uncharacterized protein n=1 Tax=Morococcus cerebrosus TaxID=1056807 RepID=A0A0C1EAV8_9NEIS|nr:hypothetical protein MCC93_25800 [Morococcus cerebrosus]
MIFRRPVGQLKDDLSKRSSENTESQDKEGCRTDRKELSA